MGLRITCVLVVAAACRFSGPAQDPPGDGPGGGGDGPPADADFIDAAIPDADVDGSQVVDTDGDGVLDSVDNCVEVANQTQWNEDGDAEGDACDPCPQIGVVQADGDGDGIGNDCDPRPTQAGDELVLFEGFNVPGSGPPTAWSTATIGAGGWNIEGGELTFATIADGESVLDVAVPGGLGADHTVDATGVITSTTGGGVQVMAVLTDYTTGGGQLRFFHCAVRADSNGEVELFMRTGSSGSPTWTRLEFMETPTVSLGTPYRMLSRVNGADQDCVAAGRSLDGDEPEFGGNRIGLRVRNATASYAYVAVYRAP